MTDPVDKFMRDNKGLMDDLAVQEECDKLRAERDTLTRSLAEAREREEKLREVLERIERNCDDEHYNERVIQKFAPEALRYLDAQPSGPAGGEAHPEYYWKDSAGTTYTKHDPEVTCRHCVRTFRCDMFDKTCRLCNQPFSEPKP